MSNRTGKRILAGLIALLLLIVSCTPYQTTESPPGLGPLQIEMQNGLIVPNQLELTLGTDFIDGEHLPVLSIREIIGSGCSDRQLSTNVTYSSEQVVMEVAGFPPSPYEEVCQMIIGAKHVEKVSIDWLTRSSQKRIFIKLNGKENVFTLTRDNYLVHLEPIKQSNVIARPQSVTLYPPDVALLRVYASPKIDYRDALTMFGRSKGWLPLQKVYAIDPKDQRYDAVYIVLHDRILPEAHRAETVGYLPDGTKVTLQRING